MPIIDVEGVGKIELQGDWSDDDISSFLQEQFGSKPDRGFFQAFGDSYAQAEEDFALGTLLVSGDKAEAIDLLEGELNQFQNSDKLEYESSGWRNFLGEVFGGVARDVGAGLAVGTGASVVTTPIGGAIAGLATTTGLQATTAKGGSMRDAYVQIRIDQLKRGVDDKDAAYETARKISNTDAALAAGETIISTAVPIPGVGQGATRIVTKGMAEVAFDSTVGAVGSVTSDVSAEAIGGEQGVDRGDIWENAKRAAVAEPIVGGLGSIRRTRRAFKEYKGRQKSINEMLERGQQIQQQQQDIDDQAELIFERGLERERRFQQGAAQDGTEAKRETRTEPVIIEGRPVKPEERLVLPPDASNVPPPGMGVSIESDEQLATGSISPILDDKGRVLVSPSHAIDPTTTIREPGTAVTDLGTHLDAGTEARALQAQRARAIAGFSRMSREKLNDVSEWTTSRIQQLQAMKERGRKNPQGEFPLVEGGVEAQYGWPENAIPLDKLGLDTTVMDVINPERNKFGLDINAEISRLEDLKGRLAARKAELEMAEGEAESAGRPIQNFREPSVADKNIPIIKAASAPGLPLIQAEKPAQQSNLILPDSVKPETTPETRITEEVIPGLKKPVTLFHSGFQGARPAEAKVVTEMQVPMGMAVFGEKGGKLTRLGKQKRQYAADHLENGGKLFLDSGEFNLAGKGVSVPLEGKRNLFDEYDNIVGDIAPENRGNVTLVMPDVIGDQQASLDLQRKHSAKIQQYIDDGFDVIIPIQKGKKTLTEAHDEVAAEFGEGNFRVGVPSNKKAVTNKELSDFMKTSKPSKIHMLGIGSSTKAGKSKIDMVQNIAPEADITLDSSTAARAAALAGKESKSKSERTRAEALRKTGREKVGEETYWKAEDEGITDFTEDIGSIFLDPLKNQSIDLKSALGVVQEDSAAWDKVVKQGGNLHEFLAEVHKSEFNEAPTDEEYAGQAADYQLTAETLTGGVAKQLGAEVLQNNPDALPEQQAAAENEARAEGVKQKIDNQKAQEAVNEIITALKEFGDPTKMGMGIDPTPAWRAFKGMVKWAHYWAERGVKSAPEFAKKLGVKLTAPLAKAWEYGKNKRKFRAKDVPKDILAHLNRPDFNESPEAKSKQETIKLINSIVYPSTGDVVLRKAADKYIGIKNMQDFYADGKPIPDTSNTYMAQQNMDGIVGAKMKDFRERMEGVLQQIKDANIQMSNFEDYLYARHAVERNNHIAKINPKFPDGGSGMTNSDAKAIIDAIEAEGKTEQFDALAEQIYQINRETLAIQLEGGLIDQRNYDALSQYYQNYIPLKGHHDSDPFTQKSGNYIPISGEIKGRENLFALGHGERSTDLLAHAFEQHATAIQRAERNKVYQTLGNWVMQHPENSIIEVATTENAPTEPKRTPAKFEKIGGVDIIVEEPTVKTVKQSGWANNPDIVAFKVNGEQVYLRVKNENLAYNLKNMGTADVGEFIRHMAGFQRWRAMTNTMLNIDFPLGNFIRDLGTAGINLGAEENAVALQKAAMKNVKSAFKTVWRTERGKKLDPEMAELYELFRKSGGKMEFTSLHNLENNIRLIEEFDASVTPDKYSVISEIKNWREGGVKPISKALRIRARHASNKITGKKYAKAAYKLLEDANAAMENATRFAVFKAALETGKATPAQAANLARNITVNFTKKGEAGTALNAAFLFYNARVQGALRIVQAAKSKRVQKILGGIMAAGVFEGVFNQLVGEEDEDGFTDYDKVADYIKKSHILIPTDWIGELFGKAIGSQLEDENGNLLDGKFITIPMPYGYNVFHYAGRQIPATIPALGGKKDVWDSTVDTINTGINAFNPIGGSENIWMNIMPDIGKFPLEIISNEDWKGDAIAPERNPFAKYDKPDSEMYWSTAKGTSIATARFLNSISGGTPEKAGLIDVSPETLDHAIQFITGGMGQTLNRAINIPAKAIEGTLRAEDIPIIRRFQEDPSPYFEIENHRELQASVYEAEAGLLRLRREKAGPRKIQNFKAENRLNLRMLGRVKAVDRKLKEFNAKLKQIKANTTWSRAKKQQMLQRVNDAKTDLLRSNQQKLVELLAKE